MKLHPLCIGIIQLQLGLLTTHVSSFTLLPLPSSTTTKVVSQPVTAKYPFSLKNKSNTNYLFMSNDNIQSDDDDDDDQTSLLTNANTNTIIETKTTTKTTTQTQTTTKITTSDAERLKYQAQKMKLEAEKMEAELTLQKIQVLEQRLIDLDIDNNDNNNTKNNNLTKEVMIQQNKLDIKKQIQTLVKNINPELLPTLPINFDTVEEEEKELSDEIRRQMKLVKDGGSTSTTSSTNVYKSKEEAAAKNEKTSIDVTPSLTSSSSSSSSKPKIETNLYKDRMASLSSSSNESTTTNKNKSITEPELQSAVEYYLTLPKPMRKALACAIDLDDDKTSPSIIVLGLYEFMNTSSLRSYRLNQLYNDELEQGLKQHQQLSPTTLDEAMSMIESNSGSIGSSGMKNNMNNNNDEVSIFQPSEDTKLETMVESFLPRVTRKEGKEPTLADVNMLKACKILGKDTFQMTMPPQKVPGGYILRGEMVPKLRGDCNELIRILDEKINDTSSSSSSSPQLPEDWKEKFQIDIMTDPTPALFENEESFDGDIVLVVHSRDMNPTTNRLLLSGVSTVSLFFTFIFVIATYSQNPVVMERLTTANAVGDYDLTWFNQLISPLLISLGVSQAFHEAGHLFIAKKDGFKITPPTILPLVALPYMSFQQNIKTSPKNFDSLFNFGAIGPALGMVSSFAFFLIGLQMTLTMDASALEYAPSVPVLFLKLSTLGGTIVDNVIGGGQGIITQQDPLTPVKLHPFAIGGLASLMINCLDTIPLPGTDGGRMSQSLLGRSGQVAFGGVTYFALLAYTFLSGHRDIFLTFLFVNSFSRQDNEIPCRNEIDRAGLGQAAIALVMWSIAILTLTPLD